MPGKIDKQTMNVLIKGEKIADRVVRKPGLQEQVITVPDRLPPRSSRVLIVSFAMIDNRKVLFSILFLLGLLFSGTKVNPISYGLSPLYDKDLSVVARTLAKNDPESLWLFFGNNYGASFLKALGLNVFNGVHYVPDLRSMEMLDPERRSRVFYNRYAHIEFHIRSDD